MSDGRVHSIETGSSGSHIAVIDKAVRVLDSLLATPDGLTPSEVGKAVSINRSTAFRLLASLEHAGMVSRDVSAGRYYLGMKMLQYGAAVRRSMAIVRIAEPVLQGLRDNVRQSALLAIREGWGARCLVRISGPDVDVLTWTTGEWLPLHVGAAPQALLSALTDDELEEYLASPHAAPPGDAPVNAQKIRDTVTLTRQRGWALNDAEITPGVNSLGAVVRNSYGAPVCSISVAGLAQHYAGAELDATARAVLAAAAEISGRLR